MVQSRAMGPASISADIGAVLFDMDGLLLDSEPLWDEVTHAFCVARGGVYTEADSQACRGRGIAHTARYLAETKGFVLDVAETVTQIETAFVAAVPRARFCLGAEELLRSLSGRLPIALGSSSPRIIVEAALTARGALSLFDAVVTGSDVERRKPAPDIFLACARLLDVDPARCLVLEDSVPGCEAARAAGMRVFGVLATVDDALRLAATELHPDLFAVARRISAVPASPHLVAGAHLDT